MSKLKIISFLSVIVFSFTILSLPLCADSSLRDIHVDVTSGIIETGSTEMEARPVDLPESFDIKEARAQFLKARKNNNEELMKELGQQIRAWYLMNRKDEYEEIRTGSSSPAPERYFENEREEGSYSDWGNDVRIEPGIARDVKIATTSNGDIYAYYKWYDAGDVQMTIRRSVDYGLTWDVYYDNNFAGYDILDHNLLVANDTLIMSYILERNADGFMRTWMISTLPGASYNPVYWDSPTGNFNNVTYADFTVTTDAPHFLDGYLLAGWIEDYRGTSDSTRVMAAGSYDKDPSTWDNPPVRIERTTGADIYFQDLDVAYGSTANYRVWLISSLHPAAYPTTYDEVIWGWFSDDWAASWNGIHYVTSIDDGRDEYDCCIAGSHSSQNWVVLATHEDTLGLNDKDVNSWYSTDDTTWTFNAWVNNDYENFLADIWVDDNSNGFWAGLRQDTGSEERIKVKLGDITDPTLWSQSYTICDDPTHNFSNVYGLSMSYSFVSDTCITGWTSYEGSEYSIWFDAANGAGVSEEPDVVNPLWISNHGEIATLKYSISVKGNVEINLHDITGRKIREIESGLKLPGNHEVTFDTNDLTSGIYFVHLNSPDKTSTGKMTVIR